MSQVLNFSMYTINMEHRSVKLNIINFNSNITVIEQTNKNKQKTKKMKDWREKN